MGKFEKTILLTRDLELSGISCYSILKKEPMPISVIENQIQKSELAEVAKEGCVAQPSRVRADLFAC